MVLAHNRADPVAAASRWYQYIVLNRTVLLHPATTAANVTNGIWWERRAESYNDVWPLLGGLLGGLGALEDLDVS